MESVAGFFVTGLIILGCLILAVKVIGLWQRLMNQQWGASIRQSASRPNIEAGGIVYYRTRNGRSDYKFRIDRAPGGGYRAYILAQPGYGSRKTENYATHRLRDGRGYYVCWTKRLDSPEEARRVAACWADSTEDYILHGRRF